MGIVYDPRGQVEAERKPLAPRRAQLAGLRVGVLDDTKWNANRLLDGVAALLDEVSGAGAVGLARRRALSLHA